MGKFFKTKLLFLTLLCAFLLRIYRINDLLGFYYDQGRDALVIWDLIHKGKLFLIGPMMGFTGIFRGPWYYYLIAPFYFLGQGSPLWPSVFLILTSVFALYVLFAVGRMLGGTKVGLTATFIAAGSFYIISASRWLSNPTPMLLVGISLVWATFKFLESSKKPKNSTWTIPLIALLCGLGLNFGSATEIYYIPALILIFILKRKLLPDRKIILLSISIFLSVFLPQVIFEIRHPGVLSGALYSFVFQKETFTFSFWEIIKTRGAFYYGIFTSKLWTDGSVLAAPFFTIFVGTIIIKWKEFWKDDRFKVLFVFTIAPFLGTLFFVSNLGGFYDYYFTGYYLIFILIFSFVLVKLERGALGNVVLFTFLIIFSVKNYISFQNNYSVSLNHPEIIAFKNQLNAVDWIYTNSNGEDFNVDVYVPPVVPYAYDYLFAWRGEEKYQRLPSSNQIDLLYTLYEVDPPHPERLSAWIKRQEGIGTVEEELRFGGIVVQRRTRFKD